MALVRWAPFDLASDGFDELIRKTFGDFGTSLLANGGTRAFAPPLDAYLEGEQLHVRLEVPGIDPDNDIEIDVENGMLRVRGERKHEAAEEGTGWVRREMRHGTFERAVALPEGVDGESIAATYDAGILDITVPLPAKQRTKVKVDVGASPKQLEQ